MALRSLPSLSLSRSRPQGWPGERLTPRERQRLEERLRRIEREPVFRTTKSIAADYERKLRSYARRIGEIGVLVPSLPKVTLRKPRVFNRLRATC